jgi:uncharacterized protein YbcI
MSPRREHDEHDAYQQGESLLSRISTEIVRIQKEAFGKGPLKAKSYMFDDMLLVVMRGGLTTAEKTMLDFGRGDLVRSFRQEFENEMTSRFVQSIEELTNRKVLTYQSQILFDPDLVVELFVFDRVAGDPERFVAAEARIEDEPAGEVRGDDVDRAEGR